MAPLKLTLTCVIVLAAIVPNALCQDGSNGTSNAQTDDGATQSEKTSLEKGMEPIFNIYHSFLNTVMKENFYDSSASFSYQKLVTIVKEDDYQQLQSDWQNLLKTFGGFAACIIVGLIFMVAMPIIGLLFCCCYCCCHKCGGTRERYDPKSAKCQRVVYVTLLLIFTTLALVGGIICFLGADLLHKATKNEDNRGLVGRLDSSLGQLQTFANDSIQEFKVQTRRTIIDEGLTEITGKVERSVNKTVAEVQASLNATQVLNQADRMGQDAQLALEDVRTVNASLHRLQDLQSNVTTELDNIKLGIQLYCNGSSVPSGFTCPSTDHLFFLPNFLSLDRLTREADALERAQEIQTFVNTARREFDSISDSVHTEVQGKIDSSKADIKKVSDDVEQDLNKVTDSVTSSLTSGLQDARTEVNARSEDITNAGNYIWYSYIGLACTVMLVVLFYYLGVLFGLCGERPGPRAACCNKGTGSNLLVAGICCSFLFAAIVMLAVIITFVAGGLSYTMACRYLDDGVENVDTFEDILSDGFEWNVTGELNISISQMFKNCKANQAIYTALNMKRLYDIDTVLNVTDVTAEVTKIATTASLSINNITLLTQDLQDQLNEFANANISDVNFTEYTTELEKTVVPNLTVSITQLNTTRIPELQTQARNLQSLQDHQLANVDSEKAQLQAAITNLSRHADIRVQVANLEASIQSSQDTFNSRKDAIVKEELNRTAASIVDDINRIVGTYRTQVTSDLAKCAPLYAAAQGVSDAVCVTTLDPLNTTWFGLGWALFFYIPCFIFAALLSGLYKRTERYVKKDHFDDPMPGGYDGYSRGDDNIPLTSQNMRNDLNGKFNRAFDNGHDQGRANREEPQYQTPGRRGYESDPYLGSAGQGSSGYQGYHGGAGARGGYDDPPHYDEVTKHGRYHGGGQSSGYPYAQKY